MSERDHERDSAEAQWNPVKGECEHNWERVPLIYDHLDEFICSRCGKAEWAELPE